MLLLVVFLCGSVLFTAAAGGTVALAGYAYFSKDLPDPRQALDALVFTQQTKVYDRTGAVLLATLGTDRRVLATFGEIPPELIDATTSIEDKTFWDNPGFDPAGFVSAAIDTLQGNDRGGSTITQQLVKTRLLPASAFANGPYERKVKEIIQAIRLTDAYPGRAGKEAIIEAYLNNSFYGNRSYGVAAAARGYFGKDLKDLTLAECALLAGIPQSPTTFDLVRNAVEETYTDAKGVEQVRLVVPPDAAVVLRRNVILDKMKTLQGAHGRQVHGRGLRGREGGAGDPRLRRRRPSGVPRTSCGRSGTSWARSCAGPAPTPARRSTPAATR